LVNPNVSIAIKNSNGEVVDKYNYDNIVCDASSTFGSNNILFYVEQWVHYYVSIEVEQLDYSFFNF
jgi:hypothetical protein